MLKELAARLQQGHRTIGYPKVEPVMLDRYRGMPEIDNGKCNANCSACVEVCPTHAISKVEGGICIDLGKCIFCASCAELCKDHAISFTKEHRMATWKREALVTGSGERTGDEAPADGRIRLFSASFKIRQVSAGGCNACEADISVLGTIGFDLGRFGIQVVASPRHADGLLITGPVPVNMKLALRKTYDALPSPKFVVAVGACAISGGVFFEGQQQCLGAADIVPVDMWIPGCPPHPLTILDGLLKLTGKVRT